MGKYKNYTLYAKIAGHSSEKYSIEEAVKNDEKRGLELMSGELIEKLDRMTSQYESPIDLLTSYPEEVYGQKFTLYEPVIIVDKHIEDRSKSYPIFEIVFMEDAKELSNKENIRMWLLDYLTNHIDRISDFRGINEIYSNMKKKYPSMGIIQLINNTVNKYFEEDNYKRYREAYFTLKELDYTREKKDEIHR